jgi:hypothetical protein
VQGVKIVLKKQEHTTPAHSAFSRQWSLTVAVYTDRCENTFIMEMMFCCNNRAGADNGEEPPFANAKDRDAELARLNGTGRKATPRVGTQGDADEPEGTVHHTAKFVEIPMPIVSNDLTSASVLPSYPFLSVQADPVVDEKETAAQVNTSAALAHLDLDCCGQTINAGVRGKEGRETCAAQRLEEVGAPRPCAIIVNSVDLTVVGVVSWEAQVDATVAETALALVSPPPSPTKQAASPQPEGTQFLKVGSIWAGWQVLQSQKNGKVAERRPPSASVCGALLWGLLVLTLVFVTCLVSVLLLEHGD